MAYTPINWQTGDIITAEKMNKMDNGWGLQETQLFSETATTVAGEYGNETKLTYINPITADSIIVTFDGIEYACSSVIVEGEENTYGYGGVDSSWSYDFSQYPFAIVSGNGVNTFATQTAGTYTVAVSGASIEVSDNFSNAVNKSVDKSLMPFRIVLGETTFSEVATAFNEGRICYTYNLAGRLSVAVIVKAGNFSVTCITVVSTSTIATEVFAASSVDDVLQQ